MSKSIYKNTYILKDNTPQHLYDLGFRKNNKLENGYVYNFPVLKYGKMITLRGRIIAYTDTEEIKIDVMVNDYASYRPFYNIDCGNYDPIINKINANILREFKKLGIERKHNNKEVEIKKKQMETIKIKSTDKELILPEKIQKGCWIDLRAAEDVIIMKGDFRLINLGIAMEIPVGFEAILAPRSSTFKNYGIIQTNGIGVIDGFSTDENGNIIQGTGYCGDNDIWKMPVYATRNVEIKKNDRICQFRIQKKQPDIEFVEVEHLGNADRSGFGSTGK